MPSPPSRSEFITQRAMNNHEQVQMLNFVCAEAMAVFMTGYTRTLYTRTLSLCKTTPLSLFQADST